ncbi:alpha/beta hydrolase family protein [Thalassotalea atypica]|uniref:alpha/beta hydrolase family protein n=1 Tax=Thalassotalea atypica TaxID=2054316 RepID=UPI002572D2F2|nr:prolyl oligopeptidase family serine peptidase [Thalassotalea atypica]
MRIFQLLFLLCLISTSISSKPIPIEAYGSLPKTSMMVLSPSGTKIAYRLTKEGKDFFMIYDLNGSKSIGAIDIGDIRPDSAYFIDEDRLILVASDNAKLWGYKGRHEISAAFSYNVKDKKLRQLLRLGDGIHDGQTALGRIVGVSNDGREVYMPAWENGATFSLMKTKLDSKRKARRFTKGKSDTIDFFVCNDLPIARERFDNKKDLHRIEVFKNEEWVEIYREKTDIKTKSFVGLTADVKHLVFLQHSNKGIVSYYTMALEDGEVGGPIFAQSDKDVEYVMTDINRIVYGVRYSGFTPSYEFFDAQATKMITDVVELVPNSSVTLVDHTPEWNKLIFLIEGNNSVGEYYLYSNEKLRFLASRRPDISTEQINQIVQTKIKARDGLRIPTLLTLPNVENPQNLPAIMLPHGGPEAYDSIRFDWLAQYFASRGFLVMQPQFRGSDGFGYEFKQKGRGEWGRKMQDDLTDTLRTLAKSGYVNSERVCIVGASYGGYAALAGAAFSPELYKCAVSINGVSDIDRMMRDERREHGAEHWVVAYWQKLINNGELPENHLKLISPINYVEQINVPVLLIHGEYDKVVPLHQSKYMEDKLKDANKVVELIELEHGDHYLSNGANRMKALEAIDGFIQKHI